MNFHRNLQELSFCGSSWSHTPFFHVRTRNSSYSGAVLRIMNHEGPLLMVAVSSCGIIVLL